MSTKKINFSYLRENLIKIIQKTDRLPLIESINLILAIKGNSLAKIASRLNVSRQMPYLILTNPKKSKKVKNALRKEIGFDLWEDGGEEN